MNKIIMFNYRSNVEGDAVNRFQDQFDIEITTVSQPLNLDNYQLARGYSAISIVGGVALDKELLDKLFAIGVRYISTRSIGYDHIDVTYAKSLGMKVANNQYSPSSVGDYSVTLMLMLTRQMHVMQLKNVSYNYSMDDVKGKEMHNLTVGIIGTGKIGQVVAKRCFGFDSRVLAYDVYQNEDVKKYATYVDLETLFKESDIISLHVPYLPSTHHVINKDSIALMKKGVYIINTARGELIDSEALLDGLLKGHIGGAGLDVLEGEQPIFRNPQPFQPIDNPTYYALKAMPQVILTPHKAFLTDEATDGMVKNSLRSLSDFIHGKENALEIK